MKSLRPSAPAAWARCTKLATRVWIASSRSKFCPHASLDPEFRERFDREARAVSSTESSEHLHDLRCRSQDGTAFLVMEYLEGETLAARMAKGRIAARSGAALRHRDRRRPGSRASTRRIHRDLKPANVMMTKAGAKVLDFGLAKIQQVSEAPADPSAANYRRDRGGVDRQARCNTCRRNNWRRIPPMPCTDIFAFGTVLYEYGYGRKAFEGDSRAGLIAAILDQQPVGDFHRPTD